MDHSLTIPFTGQPGSRNPHDTLLLEQVPWGNYTGRVTKGAIVSYLRSLMYGATEPELDCGLNDDGGYSCMVLAYPSTPALPYRIASTNGSLSERVVEELEFTELVNVSMSDTVRLKYPPLEIVSVQFVGNGYDRAGNIVLAPDVGIDGGEIRLAYPVYGALRVVYRIVVHGYTATVPPLEDAVAHRLDSVVYANWDGGVAWLELESPPGADEFADSTAGCGFGFGGGSVNYPDNDPRSPEAHKVHRVIRVDYCSQTIISDNTY